MRCAADGSLTPVGTLAVVADGDYVPLCYCAKGEGRVKLAHRGLYLYAIGDDGEVESVAVLTAQVRCGVAVANGAVLMLPTECVALRGTALRGLRNMTPTRDP